MYQTSIAAFLHTRIYRTTLQDYMNTRIAEYIECLLKRLFRLSLDARSQKIHFGKKQGK